MKYLCVIPARGGSKGVPRKNVRLVRGKPLISWTIEQARNAAEHLRIVVSTDDDEIAEIARTAGAEVPFIRPSHLAGDSTSTEAVVLHALSELGATGYRPDAVMLLQATSPVRLPGTIDRALAQFEATDCDSLVGVVPQSPFLWRIGDSPVPQYDVRHRQRRQDLAEADVPQRETGSIYVTRTYLYEQVNNRLGGRISLFVMDEIEGIDIDTETDLLLAGHALNQIQEPHP